MKNAEFTVGSHILVCGNKGIVEKVNKTNEYKVDFNGEVLGDGLECFNEETAEEARAKGYNLVPTGRTATYFTVSFANEESLAGTAYDNSEFGCLDEFENYGTW